MLLYLLPAFLYLLCSVSPAEVHVNMITEYVNNHAEILLMPRDHITFRAATCGRYDSGYDVTVKIDIPENPGFNSDLGVVLFALSNSNSSSNGVISDPICSSDDPNNYKNTCTGPAQKGDIYLHTYSNERPDVRFSVTITFTLSDGTQESITPRDFTMPETDSYTDLVQVFNHRELITLSYAEAVLITLKICPNQYTTKQYKFTSIFQATDTESKSLIAQAICTSDTCNFDDKSKVGDNIFDLPVSHATSGSIHVQDLYVYAVCFGGVLSDDKSVPEGTFKFGGLLEPVN